MQESEENVRIVHAECAKKAGLRKTYPNVPLEKFIGKYVKVGFPVTDEFKEFMWIMVKEITKDGNLWGSLNNDPVYVDYVKCDDIVEVSRDEIVLVTKPGSDKFLSEEDLM